MTCKKFKYDKFLKNNPDFNEESFKDNVKSAFLDIQEAWQNQDHETGLLMLTDTAKQNCSQDRLEIFFSSGSDAAYEIARGRKMKVGRYSFPVTLFTSRSGTGNSVHPQKSEIVVIRASRDEWAIDKLP